MIPGSANPLLLASAAEAGAYQISRSVRLNSADSAYFSRTPASAGNRKTWTWAGWLKRSGLSNVVSFQRLFAVTGETSLRFESDDTLMFRDRYGVTNAQLTTTAVYRDLSAWYHIVLSVDTTKGTAADRIKIYVNGTQETSFSTQINPSQNLDTRINDASIHYIGTSPSAGTGNFSGYLADFHFIDGQALDPTSFTEVDATTGQLVPIEYANPYTVGTVQFAYNASSTAMDSASTSLTLDVTGYSYSTWTGSVNSSAVGGANSVKVLRSTSGDPVVWAVSTTNATPYLWLSQDGINWTSPGTKYTTNGTTVYLTAPYLGFAGGANDNVWTIGSDVDGPNTFHLPFSDNSTAAALGTDTSGAGNNWTVNNISVTAGSGNDSLVDTPTNYGTDTGAGGEVRGNYATLNPLDRIGTSTYPATSAVLSNGNLDWSTIGQSGYGFVRGTIGVVSGKWYWEVSATNVGDTLVIGIAKQDSLSPVPTFPYLGQDAKGWGYLSSTGQKYNNDTASSYGASYAANDIIGIALDADNGTLTFYKNGVSQGQAFTGLTSGPYFPAISDFSGGGTTGCSAVFNWGARPFAYTAPSGFKALCTQNLDDPLVAKPSTAMDVALYTGNGSTQTISGLGFSPDLVWIKARSGTNTWHALFDSVRGNTKVLYSNATSSEVTGTALTSFDSSGFTLGLDISQARANDNSVPYVAWTWDAGSSTVSNTDGSITSSVRANASAGFSVVTYTGNGSSASVGHGLNAVPSLMIVKRRDSAVDWVVYHSTQGKDKYLLLNTTNAAATESSYWGGSGPSSTVINYGSGYGGVNTTSGLYVAYCFAPVDGYSSFGSYTGNGSADGPFVYTGFRPRWVMVKRIDSADNWYIYDAARDGFNVNNDSLSPNLANAEFDGVTFPMIDLLSNGFKMRDTYAGRNGNGATIIYAAFAESPFAYARAR